MCTSTNQNLALFGTLGITTSFEYSRAMIRALKDIKTSIVYTSTINPGGWVPKKALRSVYRREYPRFLRTFTQYVSKKNQSLPLDLINQSIGKHISSFWTLYCRLVPKIITVVMVIMDQLVRHMYLLPSHILPSVCERFKLSLQQFAQLFKNALLLIINVRAGVWPILVHPSRAGEVQKYDWLSLSVPMCRSI